MILIILTFRYPVGNVLLGRWSEFLDGVEAVDEDAQLLRRPNAVRDQYLALVSIYKALGGGWRTPNPPPHGSGMD